MCNGIGFHAFLIVSLFFWSFSAYAMDDPRLSRRLSPNERLLDAAANGTLSDVEAALAAGAPVQVVDSDGQTPLYLALFFNEQWETIAPFLLARGAKLNARLFIKNIEFDSFQKAAVTLLHCAVYFNRTDVILFLLTSGSSLTAATYRHETALYCATAQGNIEAMCLLIQRGLSPAGMLYVAAQYNQVAAAQLLIDTYNIDVNIEGANRMTPLLCACAFQCGEMVTFLLKRGAKIGNSAIHATVKSFFSA